MADDCKTDSPALRRAKILYCLDYLMRSFNDEDEHECWLENGVPDGTLHSGNDLSEDQVRDHACYCETQDELDELVALAARTLFANVYPGAWWKIRFADGFSFRPGKYERKVLV